MNNLLMADKYASDGEYESAIDIYEISLASDELINKNIVYCNLGFCYIQIKDYDNALKNLFRALEFKVNYETFFNIAYCFALKKNIKKSIMYFNRAYTLCRNKEEEEECEHALSLLLK